MNDDRCYHIPTSPGQQLCTCTDARMWRDLCIELLCRRVAELEEQVQRGTVTLIDLK